MVLRRTIIERPFGSRDPLRPRIVSLGDDSDVSTTNGDICNHTIHVASNLINQRNPVFKQNADVSLRSLQQETSTAPSQCVIPPFFSSTVLSSSSTAFASTSKTFATFSPALLSSISAKELDVAAFDSKAIQPALAPTHALGEETHSVLASIMENADILDVLMLNCPDFQTLFALVTSCKTAKRVFEQHPVGIIKEMLKTMPQELQDLTTALIGTNGCHIGTSHSIKRHMEIWLGMRPKPLMGRLRVCTSELKTDTYMRRALR